MAANDGKKRRIDRLVDQLVTADEVADAYRERKKAAGEEAEYEAPGLMERVLLTQLLNQTAIADHVTAGPGGAPTEGSADAFMRRLESYREAFRAEIKMWVANEVVPAMTRLVVENVRGGAPMPQAGVVANLVATPEEAKALDIALAKAGLPPGRTPEEILTNAVNMGYTPEQISELKKKFATLKQQLASQEKPAQTVPVRLNPAAVHAAFENLLAKHKVPNKPARQILELLVSTPQGGDMLTLMAHDSLWIQRKRAAKGGGA